MSGEYGSKASSSARVRMQLSHQRGVSFGGFNLSCSILFLSSPVKVKWGKRDYAAHAGLSRITRYTG